VAACITVTSAFVTVYARNSFTVWSHTNPWDHGFSDVRVKQSFFSPETFKLGKPTEFKVGKRRHRQSPYKKPMLNCTKEKPRLLFGGVEIVYIFGCAVNQSALWFTSEQQVFLALRPVLLSLRT
jgi:hypothetical protein